MEGMYNDNFVSLQFSISTTQLLGFLDLYQISLHSSHRRKQVFSLTPTGQPLIWNTVCVECLSVIKVLTESLSVGKKGFGASLESAQSPSTDVPFGSIQQSNTSYSSFTRSEGLYIHIRSHSHSLIN